MAALLGYAGLKEKTAKPDEAQRLYQKAVEQFPNEPAVHNNLGLFLARQNQHAESARSLSRAVALQPQNPLYRNNLATVLVEMNRIPEAYSHLKAAHGEAGGYYNLGFLLQKKGNTQEAMGYFSAALRADPTMPPAQQWLLKLQDTQSLPQYSQQTRPSSATERPTASVYGPAASMARAPQHDSNPAYPTGGGGNAPPASGSWGAPVGLPDASRSAAAVYGPPSNAPSAPMPPASHAPAMQAAPQRLSEQPPAGSVPAHYDHREGGDAIPAARAPLRLSPRTASELAPLPPARSQAAPAAPVHEPSAQAVSRAPGAALSGGLPSAPLPPGDPARMQRLPLVR